MAVRNKHIAGIASHGDEGVQVAEESIDIAPLRYCPHRPWPKQQLFLDLTCKEAFYGGAAGGGKSDALLMAALQYVHVPGYSALILRKDTQRLKLSGGLITRSHEWLALSDAVWNQNTQRWTFATDGAPATISFGYLRDSYEKFRYGSSEYQFIAFDELTEFLEDDYLFLFSRLRKRKEIDVPLRVRSASNPGNLGHGWVLQRFIPDEACTGDMSSDVYWKNDIAYVPARIRDNPAINEEEYAESLKNLPPVERQRLMHGDWSIREAGVFRTSWLQRYEQHDQRLDLLHANGNVFAHVDERKCYRFVTIDPAGTSADRAAQKKGRPASWTVMQVWDLPDGKAQRYMLLRHVVRERLGFDQLCHYVRRIYKEWRPKRMYIEGEKLGNAVCDHLGHELPIDTIRTNGDDKLTRAGQLTVRLERGEVFVPRSAAPWLAAFESELLGWTGAKDEVCDQIDAAAYAAIIADERPHQPIKCEPFFHG